MNQTSSRQPLLTDPAKRLGIILLWVLLAFGLWFFRRNSPEPQYKGRPLSQWLATTYDLQDGRWIVGRSAEFNEAMHAMGINTIPHLVRMLSNNDPPMSRFLSQNIVRDVANPVWNGLGMNHAFFQRARAARGFEVLGSQATNAIPSLLRNRPTGELVDALNGIGREGQPIVLQFLAEGDAKVKLTCLYALQAAAYDRKVAVEKWIQYTTNASPELRFHATALLMVAPREFADDVVNAAKRARADPDRRVSAISSSLVERFNSFSVGNVLVP